jgi:hypothetical protein
VGVALDVQLKHSDRRFKMAKKYVSGKSKLRSGIIQYALAELRTLNRRKMRALFNIVSGYLMMKLGSLKNGRKEIAYKA